MTIETSRLVSRRNFLQLATGLGTWAAAPDAVTYPSWMPRMAFAPPGVEPQGDILLAIFQRGGMDGLNAVIPHGDADYYHLRQALAIPEPASGNDNSGIDLDGFFGLHPALQPLKDLWHARSLPTAHPLAPPHPPHSHSAALASLPRA